MQIGKEFKIIRRPIITEKSVKLSKQGKYVFEVAKSATKPEIKKAIEKIYKVKVKKVNIVKVPSKKRGWGKYEGEKRGFKKAIVTLKEGKIDLGI